jgi:catechol O-methyltransferase
MINNSKMNSVLNYVFKNAKQDNPQSVLNTIDSFVSETGTFLMNVGPEKGKLLAETIKDHKPLNTLELGSFLGYSAIIIAMFLPEAGSLVSVDHDKDSVAASKEIVKYAGLENKVHFINSTSDEAINALKKSFDFIFIDHEKNRYYSDLLLMENLNLINKGGIVFADNVGIFEDKMKDYFSHVRDSGAYTSKNIGAHLEYRDNVYDAVEISKFN